MVASKVLVVDDEPVVTDSCQRILSREGLHVDIAQSGREGLDRALGAHFDVVVTDLRMPDLDGMDLVRRLAAERPGTALVVITGYGAIPSAVEAMKLGVVDYIEKPFTPKQFADAVKRALPGQADPDPEADSAPLREALKKAATDRRFGDRLLAEGSRVLTGFPLSRDAKAAIASGDIAWIEKRCGDLSDEERAWLQRRLEAETW